MKKSEPLEEKLEALSEKIQGKPLAETIAEFQEGIKGTDLEEKLEKLEDTILDGPMGEKLAEWEEKMEEKMENGQMDKMLAQWAGGDRANGNQVDQTFGGWEDKTYDPMQRQKAANWDNDDDLDEKDWHDRSYEKQIDWLKHEKKEKRDHPDEAFGFIMEVADKLGKHNNKWENVPKDEQDEVIRDWVDLDEKEKMAVIWMGVFMGLCACIPWCLAFACLYKTCRRDREIRRKIKQALVRQKMQIDKAQHVQFQAFN